MRAGRLLPLAVNWLWLQNSYAGNRRFSRALENPGPTQELYLKNLLRRNESTQYGRANHFSQISSIRDFQENIPLTRYEDYLPYIEEISRGKSSVLTHDPVALFQPTSGTSSASKLIPYNQPLKAEYQMAISPWVYNLFRRVPGLMRGRAYWSISPPVERDKFHGCIPVGFDDDSEYLGGIGKRLYNLVSVGRQKFTPDISLDDFRDRTLTSLLAARNLALISVWSPTLLLTLIKHFLENQGRLIEVLASSGSPDARARAGNIRRTIQKHGLNFKAIWPDLKLISCWTHGASEPFIPEIRRYFPGTEIQGKGLVATEAFVSLPLLPDNDPVLAVNSHFFEFRDIETGKIRLAHELDRGGVYSVIVTTGGGLYR